MRPLKLIIALMLPIVTLLGCRDKTVAPTPQSVAKDMAFHTLTLQYQASELSMQVGWLRAHLEKCLAQLEAEHGLEPIEFDWTEAMGFVKIRHDPNIAQYSSKPQPFFVPYRGIKTPELKTEKYTDMARLSAIIGLTNRTLANNMLGMDKYIKHLEKRLKRLEDRLEE